MRSPSNSGNQSAPLATVIEKTRVVRGKGNSVITPAVVIRPILLPAFSTNHRLPSGPAVIPSGDALAVGIGYSVIVPDVVMRPILFADRSVNQRAPSGPAAI